MIYTLEDIADRIKATLQTKLPAELDAIDAAKADGITLDDPQVYLMADGEMFTPASKPAVFIMGDELPRSETGQKYSSTHTIDVYIEIHEANLDTAQRKTWRYAEAVHTVFAKSPDSNLEGEVSGVTITGKKTGFFGGVKTRPVAHVTMTVETRTPVYS